MSDCKHCGACENFVRCNCCGACRSCGRYHAITYTITYPPYPYYTQPYYVPYTQPIYNVPAFQQPYTWTSTGVATSGNVTASQFFSNPLPEGNS
jgi:hypothetical protein